MVIHCLAEIIDRKNIDQSLKCKYINNVMMSVGQVFPCGKCRNGIQSNWIQPNDGRCKNVKDYMYEFHNFVTHKVEMLKGKMKPIPKTEATKQKYDRKYVYLVDNGGWKAYLVSFLYAIATNCSAMTETLMRDGHGMKEFARVNFSARIKNFVSAVHSICGDVPTIEFPAAKDCNQIFSVVYRWEARMLGVRDKHIFGKMKDTKSLHLCARVNSPYYDTSVYQSNFCGSKACHGACLKCDRAAAKMVSL
jgi:hypothetical protein